MGSHCLWFESRRSSSLSSVFYQIMTTGSGRPWRASYWGITATARLVLSGIWRR